MTKTLPPQPAYGPDETPDGEEIVFDQCWKCGAEIKMTLMALKWAGAGTTACQPCIDKYMEKKHRLRVAERWKVLCPKAYRETDLKHPEFPLQEYRRIQELPLDRNILLVGPSQTGKTRVMFKRVYSAILQHMSAIVLYPTDLKELARSRFRKENVDFWCMHDLIAIDDLFEIGAHESVIDLVNDIIMRRTRDEKPMLITSMLTGAQIRDEQQKFPNVTDAERARLNKLFGRIRDHFEIRTFEPKPINSDELPF